MREEAITHPTSTDRFDLAGVNKVLAELTERCRRFLDGQPGTVGVIDYSVEARYQRQVWDLVMDLPPRHRYDEAAVADLADAFHRAHERAAGISDPDSQVECLTWRARASCHRPTTATAVSTPPGGPPTHRPVSFGAAGRHEAAVVPAGSVPTSRPLAGPAIVDAAATTVVVPPGATVLRTPSGHLLLRP